mgnify:CR=1 FL=1
MDVQKVFGWQKTKAEKNAIISEERLKRDEEISALSNKLSNKKEQITTLRKERDSLQNQLSDLRKPKIKDPQIEEYENQINEIENKISNLFIKGKFKENALITVKSEKNKLLFKQFLKNK